MSTDTESKISTIEVLVRCDPRDGNDPIEASTKLPMIPRKGDEICVWVSGGYQGGTEEYLPVETVVLCSYAPERIEVWVRPETFDLEEVKRTFKAIADNDQP